MRVRVKDRVMINGAWYMQGDAVEVAADNVTVQGYLAAGKVMEEKGGSKTPAQTAPKSPGPEQKPPIAPKPSRPRVGREYRRRDMEAEEKK